MEIKDKVYIMDSANDTVTRDTIVAAKDEVIKLAQAGEIVGFVARVGSTNYDLNVNPLTVDYQDLSEYYIAPAEDAEAVEDAAVVDKKEVEVLLAEIDDLNARIAELEPLADKYKEYADIIAKIEHLGDSRVVEIEAENERLRGIICTVKKELESVG